MKQVVILSVLVSLAALGSVGCKGNYFAEQEHNRKARAEWEQVKQEDTIAGYRKYLKKFGRFAHEARQELDRKYLELARQVQPVVRGEGNPGAAAYQPGQGPACLLLVKADGSPHAWNKELKDEWVAASPGQTALVCVLGEPRESVVEVCHFSDLRDPSKPAPSITRYLCELEARLVEARTGKVVAARTIAKYPRNVQATERWDLTRIGDPVSYTDVEAWLREFVQPPVGKNEPDAPGNVVR